MLLGMEFLASFCSTLLTSHCSANHEKDDWINGEKTEHVVAFLDRLYTAKRKVEQRIVVLGGEDDSVSCFEIYELDNTYRASVETIDCISRKRDKVGNHLA